MIAGPLPRGGGPLRHRSRSDTRDPGGTSSSWSNTYRRPVDSRPSSTAHSRRSARRESSPPAGPACSPPATAPSVSAATQPRRGRSPSGRRRTSTTGPPPSRRTPSQRRGILQPVDLADLPLMIEPGLRPPGVPLHLRRVGHLQLSGYEIHHRGRHIEGILQGPKPAHRHQLEREPQLHVFPAAAAGQRPVLVIEEEHPLQVRLRRRPRVPAVRRGLIISQELHRHTPQSRADPPATHPQPPTVTRSRSARVPPLERPVTITQRSSRPLSPLTVPLLFKGRITPRASSDSSGYNFETKNRVSAAQVPFSSDTPT